VVCAGCAKPDGPTPDLRATLGPRNDLQLRRGTGCPDCRGSGFRGRRAVAELMLLDDTLRGLIVARAAPGELKEAAGRQGMRPLREAALDLVAQGLTTLEEADRVTLDA
jgi:general secretion pathway protein E